MEYNKWKADDTMREALSVPGVMPKYFKALTEHEEEPPEGFGTIGYRLVYRIGDKLFQPFIARLGTIDHILKLDALASDENTLFADISKIDYTEKGIINTDVRGQGYYYFSDRDIAEDYMRAFVYKSAERYKLKAGYFELYRVYGVSKHNSRGDEGFVMDEMMYEPEPIVSFKAEDVYKAVHS
jgi:hypothetical protein